MSTTPYTDAVTANPLLTAEVLFPLAKAQYNCNPPSTWGTRANAAACLDAIYFLIDNRANDQIDAGGFRLNYEEYESRKKTLETRLGTSGPEANGRKRRVTAAFGRDAIG